MRIAHYMPPVISAAYKSDSKIWSSVSKRTRDICLPFSIYSAQFFGSYSLFLLYHGIALIAINFFCHSSAPTRFLMQIRIKQRVNRILFLPHPVIEWDAHTPMFDDPGSGR